MTDMRSVKSTTARSSRQLERAAYALRWLERISPSVAARAAEPFFMTPRRFAPPAAERALLEQARVDDVWSAGRRLPLYVWGYGPTVLFVHGWEGRGTQVEPLVAPLLARGFRVVAFDQPGHGSAPSGRLTVVDFARTVLAVVDQLGDVHAAVGHSVGGAALTFARAERPFGRSFVTIAAPTRPREFLAGFARAVGLTQTTLERLERRFGERYGVPFSTIDTRFHASRIDAPLLVIHDRKDREVPFLHAEALATHWPGARRLTTEGLGHRRILQDPEVIKAVVAEVSRERPGPGRFEQELSRELFDREARAVYAP